MKDRVWGAFEVLYVECQGIFRVKIVIEWVLKIG